MTRALIDAVAVLDHRVVDQTVWPLAGDPALHVVTAGAVDCFVRRKGADGRPAGAKHHLLRVREGEAFPSLEADDGAFEVLASALPDSRVLAVSANAVLAWASDPDAAGVLDAALATWVDIVALPHAEALVPRDYRPALPGVAASLGAGDALSGVVGVVWAHLRQGRCQWMGDAAAPVVPADPPLPLTRRLWISAAESAQLDVLTTADLVSDGRLWSSIHAHQRQVLARIGRALDDADAAAPAQLADRQRAASGFAQSAIGALATVVGRRASRIGRYENALFSALDILGRRQGITFDFGRVGGLAAETPARAIRAIADASRIRHRDVILRGDWWTGDNGSLLVKSREEDRWFALLCERNGHNMLHCPQTGEVRRVDAEVAETLSPMGTAFYRPFEDQKMTALGVLRFALFGLRGDVATVLIIAAITGGLGLVMPVLNGFVFEKVIPSGQTGDMLTVGAVLVAVTISTSLFSLTRSVALLRLESRMSAVVQSAVWDRLLKLPTAFFRDYTAGDLAQRATGINAIRAALSGSTLSTILTALFSSANLILLFYYDARVAAIALGLIGVAMLLMVVIGYFKLQYEKQIAAAAGALAGRLFEILGGVSKIRTAAAESRAFFTWSQDYAHLQTLRFRAQRLGIVDNTVFSGYQLATMAVIFAVVGMALADLETESMTIGEFVAFNAAFGAFFGGMAGLIDTAFRLLNIIPLYQRAKPILETLPENTDIKEIIAEPRGLIEISHVSFHYPDGSPVLKAINMTIRPGEFAAIVGPSGSGKSTLFRILMGFETPQSGTVHYDGRDSRKLDLTELRKRIGIVLQTGKLLSGDIFTNIAGASDLTLDQAWEAARMVGLEQDIRRMPMGMHTVIGEGAASLSGGQRQRVMIARAIAGRPRIVFFDEATSALDNATQAVVSESLAQLKATRIVIAHRLSTIRDADRIYVLDRGEIIERGDYDKLVAQDGVFSTLVKRQIA